jgi:hypothetical protein
MGRPKGSKNKPKVKTRRDLPILTKLIEEKRKRRTKADMELARQVMFTFRCPTCGYEAKAISRNVEFFCGVKDHKGTPMEFVK